MKLIKRNTAARVNSRRITSPETSLDRNTGKRVPLLSYGDMNSNHCHNPTTKDLFLYAAGSNEEGDLPDGLDRLMHHKFVVHLDKTDKAIGLDIVPARLYRSKVIPTSQIGVTTIKLTWEVGGAVCRCVQRPANVRAEQIIEVIKYLDGLANAGTAVNTGTKLGKHGKVVGIEGETMEIKLATGARTGNPVYEVENQLEE